MTADTCPMCGGPAMVDPETGVLTCMNGHSGFQGRTATPEERAAMMRFEEARQQLANLWASAPEGEGAQQFAFPPLAALPALKMHVATTEATLAGLDLDTTDPDTRDGLDALRLLKAVVEMLEAMAAVVELATKEPPPDSPA